MTCDKVGMRNLLVLVLLVGICAIVTSAQKKVVCYYGTWAVYRPGNGKFQVENIDPTICTHIIYTFFGVTQSGEVKSLDPYLDLEENYGKGNIKKFMKLKAQNPNVKLMFAVGGWNFGSSLFSQVVANPTTRFNFVKSIVAFTQQFGFDGFDLDWEYPNQRGGNSADKANMVQFLTELRNQMNPHNYLVSIAVGGVQFSAEKSYNIPAVAAQVDFINVMTYDLHGPWEKMTGINGAMYAGPADHSATQKQLNVDACVKFWLSAGAPASKLIVGVPTYGKSFTLSNQANHGVGATTVGAGNAGPFTREPGSLGYNEICMNKWTRVFEQTQKVPYAYSGNGQWVGYDDKESVAIKINYIKANNLGGGMIWSLETDDFHGLCGDGKYPLITSIFKGLQGFSNDDLEVDSSENAVIISCPHSFIYDPEIQSCVRIVNVKDEILKEIESGLRSEIPLNFECPENGLHADPKDKQKFYSCSFGTAYSMDCPAGFVFNPQISVCDWSKYNIEPLGFQCPGDGLYPDPENVHKFYSCSHGKAYSMDCPGELVFNPKISVCDWPKYNIEPLGFQCPGDGIYPDPENVQKFYSCANENGFNMDCPGGLVFNPDISVCDWPKYSGDAPEEEIKVKHVGSEEAFKYYYKVLLNTM